MYKHVPQHHHNNGMGILCGFYCGEQVFATLKLIFIIIVLSYYCLSVETCLFLGIDTKVLVIIFSGDVQG